MSELARKLDRRYTYRDYRTWPNDERWELINGVAWNMSPAPERLHQQISIRLLQSILPHIEQTDCEVYHAPFDVLLPKAPSQTEDEIDTVVQPDISVICNKKKLTPKGCIGAPEWIIEILSPGTSKKDKTEKLELYGRHGVSEYWIVDPGNRYVHVYLLAPDGSYPEMPNVYLRDSSIRCRVLGGLTIDLKNLFREE